MTTHCIDRARHWRVLRGTVGSIRTPACIYCGSPNPKPLTDEEWATLINWVRLNGTHNQHVHSAITVHEIDVAFARLKVLEDVYRQRFPNGRLGPP